MPFMRFLHKWHFYLVISKKCCIFAPAIPRRGCLHVIGWGSRHIKRRLLALCSDALKSRKFQSSSELSNDRCPTGYRLSLLCLFWYRICVYAYARTRTLTMWHGECLYSAWASRCRFKMMGNARALEHGTAIVGLHAFFYMP